MKKQTSFGSEFRKWRRKSGLTMGDLANKVDVPVYRISRFELNYEQMPTLMFNWLAGYLKIPTKAMNDLKALRIKQVLAKETPFKPGTYL